MGVNLYINDKMVSGPTATSAKTSAATPPPRPARSASIASFWTAATRWRMLNAPQGIPIVIQDSFVIDKMS